LESDYQRVWNYKYLGTCRVFQALYILSMLRVHDAEPTPRGFKRKSCWKFRIVSCFNIEAGRIYWEQVQKGYHDLDLLPTYRD